jgi:integrase
MGETLHQGSLAPVSHGVNAIVFLYRRVLGIDLGDFGDFARARRPVRLPAVLTKQECAALFAAMDPPMLWVAQLLYGSGLRLMEALRIRVKDLDLVRGLITVRSGKGDKDRVTMIATSLQEPLKTQLRGCRKIWAADRAEGLAGVWMPDALGRKYPNAGKEWG